MMNCWRCNIEIEHGISHEDAEECVDALLLERDVFTLALTMYDQQTMSDSARHHLGQAYAIKTSLQQSGRSFERASGPYTEAAEIKRRLG